jgi:serine phosphatase RsbU (regulator of sigma subunit)
LEKEGDEEDIYKVWSNHVFYLLSHVSSKKALEVADEMKDYATRHDSKYGFYLATISNAYIASSMGLTDRTEELLLQSIDYQKRYLPNERPSAQVYQLLISIYDSRKQYKESVRITDEALKLTTWSDYERVFLLALKCQSLFQMKPTDTTDFMKTYAQMHELLPKDGDIPSVVYDADCFHAILKEDYSQLLKLTKRISAPIARLYYECIAYEGLSRYKEALEAHKELKEWEDSLQNAEIRKLTEMNALELQAARAENEASTLRLTNQRMLLIAIVCGLLLIAIFLVIYLRRRQKQMRQLKQAYDQLEEVTTQKERIESELRIARDIQMSMVPSVFPQHEGLDMYASMTPAKEVGGDLYGYVLQGDNLYFCVGDVSGKGVPASLFMAQATRLFRTLAAQHMMPAEICTRINDELSGEDNQQGMFVTMFLGLIDLRSGHLDFCNAGHNPPIWGVPPQFLEVESNAPIGLWPGIDFVGQSFENIKGYPLFIYTDGLNEAENRQQEQYGEDRLLEVLSTSQFSSARQVVEKLVSEVEHHRNGAEPNDDLTMLCLRID